jgi:hypothetical protein
VARVVAIDRLGLRVRRVWLSAVILAMGIACGGGGHASYGQGLLQHQPVQRIPNQYHLARAGGRTAWPYEE